MKGARSNLDWVKVSGAHYEQDENLALRQEAVVKEPRYHQNRNCATPLDPTRLQLRPRTDYRVHRAVRCMTSLLAPPSAALLRVALRESWSRPTRPRGAAGG